MSVRRALVDCAVLSVQHGCVFYPNCRSCFSKLDVQQEDNTRYRCCRCGYMCLSEQVEYRYRLSLRVARSRRIFGITVFGSSLNQFFGVHATALQRLVENQEGAIEQSARVKLFQKATEDCFIGRHFIFGLKLTEKENGLWSDGSYSNGSKDIPQFVSSQMILPKASGLGGSTVVYYEALLQKALAYQRESSRLSKGFRIPQTPLLLDPEYSPTCSLDNIRVSDSRCVSQSWKRSPTGTWSLSATPPWQQSLGVITSSAEQEEGDSAHGCERQSSQLDVRPFSEPSEFFECHRITKHTARRPSAGVSAAKGQSFVKSQDSPAVRSLSRIIFPQPDYKTNSTGEGLSPRWTNSFLSSSAAQWDDVPFSESLSEFIREQKEKMLFVCERPEQNPNVLCQRQTAANDTSDREVDSSAICQKHAQMLLDVTNTPAATGNSISTKNRDLLSPHRNKSQPSNTWTWHSAPQDQDDNLTSDRKENVELHEDAYNCSADLFSGSLMTSSNPEMVNTPASSATTSGSHPSCGAIHLHQDDFKRIGNEGNIKRSFRAQELDFNPHSESTPIGKAAPGSHWDSHLTHQSSPHGVKGNLSFGDLRRNLFKQKIKNEDICCSALVSTSTPLRRGRTRKKEKLKRKEHNWTSVPQSTGGLDSKLDSGSYNKNLSDQECVEKLIPSTTAGKKASGVFLKETRQAKVCSHLWTPAKDNQHQDRGPKPLFNDMSTPPHTGVAPIGSCDGKESNKESFTSESSACDWSRDLFSDSL